MTEIKEFKKIDEIKELGNKICRLVEYYERGKGRNLELAALADVLIVISRIFENHNKRFKKLEEQIKDRERITVNE